MTKNYFEEGMHFFTPKIHSLSAPGGRAVSELPIISYTVAFLWKIFGEHVLIYKLLEYFIFLIAIFTLFKTLLNFHYSRSIIFFMMSLLLTSPLLVYYSLNFLSDVPALSLAIISFCFLVYLHRTKHQKYFYLSVVAGTLAVLLKASALIPLACVIFFVLIDIFNLNKYFKTERLIKNKLLPAIVIIVSVSAIYFWYLFARSYNTIDSGVFMLTIAPLWSLPDGASTEITKLLFNELLPQFLNRPMLAAFFLAVVYTICNVSKLDSFLKYCFVFSLLFTVTYIVMFFEVFKVHDYYLINLFILPVISFFCLLQIFKENLLEPSRAMRWVLVYTIVFNGLYSSANYRLRMIKNDKLVKWYPSISQNEMSYYGYMFWKYKNTIEPIENLKPTLRLLGIKREDIFLVLAEGGPNVALYFIDQKGYVMGQDVFNNDSLNIKNRLTENIKYILLNNIEIKKTKSFKIISPFFKRIYSQGTLELFKRNF